ncbi:MAG: flagellin [Acidobacteriota bacterium]
MAAFSVVSNLGALNAQNQLVKTQLGLSKAIARLSSGLRVNSARDDAAGLAIADALRADVAALNQGVRNSNDGIGLINVADSALAEVSNMLQRAVTLAQQAASGTSGSDGGAQKAALDAEYQAILTEIDRLNATVEFNGTFLLQGSTVTIQVGTSNTANDVISIATPTVDTTTLGLSGDLTTAANAQTELVAIQSAIDTISADRGDLGAVANRLEFTISVTTVQSENLKAAESQIRDANVAEEIVNLTRFQVLNQTGLSALAQANSTSQSVLALLG